MDNNIIMEYNKELNKITPYIISDETLNKIANMTDDLFETCSSTANISCRVYKNGLIYINRRPFSTIIDIVLLLFQKQTPFNIKIIMLNNSIMNSRNTRYMKDTLSQDDIKPYNFNDFIPISELVRKCRKIILENEIIF